jgi:hypothetical protein
VFHFLTTVTEDGAFPAQRRRMHDTHVHGTQPRPAMPSRAPAADSTSLLSMPTRRQRSEHSFTPVLCCGLLAIAVLISPIGATRGDAQTVTPASSKPDKIANALTAGPEEITRNAAVKDWPSKEGDGLTPLRDGTNGWTCLPDDPATPGNDPVCFDATFMDAVVAFFSGQTPKPTRVGYAYMLTSDAEGSNTDPMAEHATATNQWHHAGPHVMVLYPDPKMLEGVPTKPTAFGPYVMFPGTPIAHVMLPVQSGYARSHSANRTRSK